MLIDIDTLNLTTLNGIDKSTDDTSRLNNDVSQEVIHNNMITAVTFYIYLMFLHVGQAS